MLGWRGVAPVVWMDTLGQEGPLLSPRAIFLCGSFQTTPVDVKMAGSIGILEVYINDVFKQLCLRSSPPIIESRLEISIVSGMPND